MIAYIREGFSNVAQRFAAYNKYKFGLGSVSVTFDYDICIAQYRALQKNERKMILKIK